MDAIFSLYASSYTTLHAGALYLTISFITAREALCGTLGLLLPRLLYIYTAQNTVGFLSSLSVCSQSMHSRLYMPVHWTIIIFSTSELLSLKMSSFLVEVNSLAYSVQLATKVTHSCTQHEKQGKAIWFFSPH